MKHDSIAIFTPYLSVSGAALANYTAAMAKGFQDVGIQDLYLVYLCDRPGQQVTVPETARLVPLEIQRSRQAPVPLAKFLREIKPSVLISVSAFISMPATLGWLLAGKGPTKLIVSQHSTMSYKAYVEYKDNVWMRAYPQLARWLYPLASGLHANSQEVLDDLLEKIRIPVPRDRAFATANPVNLDVISRSCQTESEHPWLRHKQKPVIISAGRLAKQKNYPLLLKAFAAVRQKLAAQLVILGEDGPERQTLESLIRELGIEADVSLPGFSENPWSSIAKADVFVLPSQEEPFGLVLVEAMACGVPVIATDAIGGGPRTILDSGKNGILVPQDDVTALTEAILKVLTVQGLRQQLITAGKQRCEAFRPEAIAQQWLSFIKRLS